MSNNSYYTNEDGNKYYGSANNMTPVSKPEEEEKSSFNLMEWVFKILKFWYLFVISVSLALGLAYVKNRSWQPIYLTEAKVLIESSTAGNQYSFMQGFSGGMDYFGANNQLLILGSYDLVNRAVKKLPLDIDFYKRGRFKSNSMYDRVPIQITYNTLPVETYSVEFRFKSVDENNYEIVIENEVSQDMYPDFSLKGRYGEVVECQFFTAIVDKTEFYLPKEEILFRFRTEASLEEEFVVRLGLNYIGDATSVVGITLSSTNIPRDQDFLNQLSKEFLAHNLEAKNEEAVRTIDFINDQLGLISDSLKMSELKLRSYRRQNNMVDVESYTSTVLSKLSELDAKRSQIQLKETYFEHLSEYLSKSVSEESIVAPSSIGISDPSLLELVKNFNELQQKRSDLGVKNPNYDRYSKKMEDVKKTLIEVLVNVRNIHNMERKVYEEEYRKALGEVQGLPEKELAMIGYERVYKLNDNYYTYLLQKQSEAKIRKASNVPDNQILQTARTTYSPTNASEKSKTYITFLIIGLLLPVAFVVAKEFLNTIIRTEDDVRRSATIPLLGVLKHAVNPSVAMSIRNPKSIYTEAFRIIRTRIGFATQGKEKIIMSVSSAESGDGKTHVIQDLAGIYGMVSDKVVLVDIDIRNPNLSKEMEMRDQKGLVHAVIGQNTIDEVVYRKEGLNFDFIPAGLVPPNPSELLMSRKFKNFLAELQERYDYILIDTSPLGLVSDAYSICNLADINLMIVRAGKSNKTIFRNFMEQVKQDDIKNAYIILNDVEIVKKRTYGYGKYSYTYGSKYYYTTEKYYTNDNKYYEDEVV